MLLDVDSYAIVDKQVMDRDKELNLYKRKFEKIDEDINMLRRERKVLITQINRLENKVNYCNCDFSCYLLME